MAVYTHVDPKDIAQFLKSYDQGVALSIKGIAEGIQNTNYIIQTTKGSYILTLYEDRINCDDLPFFLGLMDHLAHKGANCATPVRDREGNFLKSLSGRPAALISFLAGKSIFQPEADHCYQVGQALAEMHLAAEGFKLSRANDLSVTGWQNIIHLLDGHGDEVADGLNDLIQDEMSFLTENWPKDLPDGIIHGDLFPGNVFFQQGDLSGIIDYYFAGNDILAYDVAICVNAWCFEADGGFNISKSSSLFRG